MLRRGGSIFSCTALVAQAAGSGFGGGMNPQDINRFAEMFAQARQNANTSGAIDPTAGSVSNTFGSPNSKFFDGNFQGGSPFMDPSIMKDVHGMVSSGMTPDVRDSVQSLLGQIASNSPNDFLKNYGGDSGGSFGKMGVMAFGVGENERGKKVARGASIMMDPATGKVSKDFVEKQLDPDDVELPRETVGDYHTEGAMEVEFEEKDSKPSDSSTEYTVEFEEKPSKK